MGDSDDEYDRRRGRDKFRGERNDYDNRRPHGRGGYDRGRGPDRRGGRDWENRGKRDYYSSRDRDMGRGSSPPSKRSRDNSYGNDQPWRGGPQESQNTQVPVEQSTPQSNVPTIMNFKGFIMQQEDDIDEGEGVRRYQEYKVEFKKTQINDFFVLHKDEEWFKFKYHPIEANKRTEEIRAGLKKRLETFVDLLNAGYMENVSLDANAGEDVLKLLDRVVVKLEGGTDKEVAEIDLDNENQTQKQDNQYHSEEQPDTDSQSKLEVEESEPAPSIKEEQSDVSKKEDEPMNEEADADIKKDPDADTEADVKPADYNYDVEAGESDTENDAEPGPPGMEAEEDVAPPGMETDAEVKKEKDAESEAVVKKEDTEEEDEDEDVNVNILHRGSLSFLFNTEPEAGTTEETKDEKPAANQEPTKEGSSEKTASAKEDSKTVATSGEPLKYKYDGSRVKRPLSLFMRAIAPNINLSDIAEVCKRYPGFLRVAATDAGPERRYYRRCWATFEHNVNIKDICWNLSNIRVKDTELNPIVNREVTNRIRPVSGVTCSPITMQLDMRLAIKLARYLDEKHKLYEANSSNGSAKVENGEMKKEEAMEEGEEQSKSNVPSENPILTSLPSNIEDEHQDVDIVNDEDGQLEIAMSVNERLKKALDSLLLYLRIVHCLDFYNGKEYPYEDEMPGRCGIMHVRDSPPAIYTKKTVYDWYKPNAEKLEELLEADQIATEEEAKKLGLKDEQVELDNFVKANTQELAKDKWLCPLSGKKFRGPEFIRKHIFNKHADSVENVKTEVKYFNDYVHDMKRPCFPDPKLRTGPLPNTPMPNNTPAASQSPSPQNGRQWQQRQQNVFVTPLPSYTPPVYPAAHIAVPSHPGSGGDTYGRITTYPPKPPRRDMGRRPVIKYRDLDAPDEGDFF